jgi:hypothetical protein
MSRILFSLVLMFLAAGLCAAQSTPYEYIVTPQERSELSELSKRFVDQMQADT